MNKPVWSTWHERLHKRLKAHPTLIPKEASVLLSVSGGQDSMVLLQLMVDLQRLHKWKLYVWHGDHGWHKGSTEIASELRSWCCKKNITFFSNKSILEETKTEEKARNWRYKMLINCAESIAIEKGQYRYILTGHTGTDRAETFIMHLARGADLTGLSSLREKRELKAGIYLVRPLLNFKREETKLICDQMHLPIWLDPSNNNLSLTRNRVRKEILPVLEVLHPGSTIRIAELSERLNNHKEDQEQLAKLLLEHIITEEGICRKNLIALPHTARVTILARWLALNNYFFLSSNQLNELSQKIDKGKPPGSIDLKNGLKVTWTKEFIRLL